MTFRLLPLSVRYAAVSALLAAPAQAALTITNFVFTPTSLQFSVSGTITGPVPFGDMTYIFLVDADGNRNYDTTSLFESATILGNFSVNGVPNAVNTFLIENSGTTEDRLTLIRDSTWMLGDTLSGDFSATWTTNVDTANAPNGLEFRWGRDNGTGGLSAYNAPVLTVPEPSGLMIFSVAMTGLFLRRRRK